MAEVEKVSFGVEVIPLGGLLPTASALRARGWRLCQMHAVRTKAGYELTYSFAKEYDLYNLRVTIEEEDPVPSITPIYACAWIYENEIVELFGVNIEDIRMNYQKKLYKLSVETPFK